MTELADLEGVYFGPGHGSYPTIESFDYLETLTLNSDGRPFLTLTQATTTADGEKKLHSEAGFLRKSPDGVLELSIAHAFAVVEMAVGEMVEEGGVITLTLDSTGLISGPRAKSIEQTRRVYRFEGDQVRTEMYMAAVEQPMQLHLISHLQRKGGDSQMSQ